MENLFKYIAVLLIGAALSFFIAEQFREDPSIALLKRMNEQRQEIIDSLEVLKEQYISTADSIMITRQNITNEYNYVYEKIDSVYNIDSNYVNAVIRFWTDSLLQLFNEPFDTL
ncbi:MAG: hypothetical protein WBH40_17215 [Ignavibacteriaceae bacterium]